MRGLTFFTHRLGGGKHFYTWRGQTFFHQWGRQTSYVVDGGGDDVVDGEERDVVLEANTLASEASKLSAGARILRVQYFSFFVSGNCFE